MKSLKFIDTSEYPEGMLNVYFEFIYRDLVYRCQKNIAGLEFFTFASYMNLPLIISRKLFQSFDCAQNGLLSQGEFTTGLSMLYGGTLEERANGLARILDFDRDNLIHIDDIKLLLYHFQIMRSITETKPVEDLLMLFFQNSSEMSTQDFVEKSLTSNSDILLLFMIYLFSFQPFNGDNVFFLHRFMKSNVHYLNHAEKEGISSSHSLKALAQSPLFLEYATAFGMILEDTTEKDSTTDKKSFSQDNEDSIEFPEYIIAYFPNNKHLLKYYLKILHDDIFCFQESSTSKKLDMMMIMNIKFSIVEKCQEVQVKSKLYYPAQINSNYEFQTFAWNFLCEDKQGMEYMVKEIRKVNGYRCISDYYKLIEDIGEGQYGKVKLGVCKSTGEKVAIKVIKKANLISESVCMLNWELDIFKFLQKINHRGIVRAYDLFQSMNSIYLVFEFIKEGNLNSFLCHEERILESDTLKSIALQVAQAVNFLHCYGIVHRDLKPENLLISNQNNQITIKLIDFGLSKVIGYYENTCESFGSLCYSAPEIIANKCHNHNIDVWSFGILLYYIHYAKLPFDDPESNLDVITQKILSGKFNFSSLNVDDDDDDDEAQLQGLITLCLTHCKTKRLSIKEVLESKWFHFAK